MKNLFFENKASVSYLVLVEFLLSVFLVAIFNIIISDMVSLFDINFYSGTEMDVSDPSIIWTQNVLYAIFKYLLPIAILFIVIRTILESMIDR